MDDNDFLLCMHIVNDMALDDLVMQGARASTAMALTFPSRKIPISVHEEWMIVVNRFRFPMK